MLQKDGKFVKEDFFKSQDTKGCITHDETTVHIR